MALYPRFINSSAVNSRAAEFPSGTPQNSALSSGVWYQGPNNGACNGVGLGIGTELNLQDSTPWGGRAAGWTLNDQYPAASTTGTARTNAAGNQKSQVIGGAGYTPRPSAPLFTCGGVAGNASQATQLIFLINNPPNAITGGVDTNYPSPTVAAATRMLSLALGWTT